MRLRDQLASQRDAAVQNAVLRAAYDEVVLTLNGNGFLESILKPGAPFPDFVLPDAEGALVSLGDKLAAGPVVVQFFRGDWCPYCRLMLDALAAALPAITAAGASLVALTPDTGGLPLRAKTEHKADFAVLSDVDSGVGLAAGVIFFVPPLYRARLAGLGLPQRHGNTALALPVPATFVLDRDGRIAWRFAEADFTRRAEPDDVIAAIRALGPTR